MSSLDELVTPGRPSFRLQADVLDGLKAACLANRDIATWSVAGVSEAQRPIPVITLGSGPRIVSLVAGSHADEPVGPETLRHFVARVLRERAKLAHLLEEFTFVVFQHINPDGESKNRPWIRLWPDPAAYLREAVRDPPGRDLEFGYPDKRRESEMVSRVLARHAPISLHISLHGMGFSEGAMLLVDPAWGYRTDALQDGFRAVAADLGLGVHDHDRKGEKGFFRLGPGIATTPSGTAMRSYFIGRGDADTAEHFGLSSMEFVRSLGGDPLTLVTEVPLFVLTPSADKQPGVASTYMDWREALPGIHKKLSRGRSISDALARFFIRPVGLRDAIRMQLRTIELGLEAIR